MMVCRSTGTTTHRVTSHVVCAVRISCRRLFHIALLVAQITKQTPHPTHSKHSKQTTNNQTAAMTTKRMKESAEASAARAQAQKTYKKLKKKRATVKQAERKRATKEQQGLDGQAQQSPLRTTQDVSVPTTWSRVLPGDAGCPSKAIYRPVEDAKINELLEKRGAAKAVKNYTASDAITETLIGLEIVYNDEKKQWHTRLLATVGQKRKKEQGKKTANENQATSLESLTKKTKKVN